jgi:hypothetical protein
VISWGFLALRAYHSGLQCLWFPDPTHGHVRKFCLELKVARRIRRCCWCTPKDSGKLEFKNDFMGPHPGLLSGS